MKHHYFFYLYVLNINFDAFYIQYVFRKSNSMAIWLINYFRSINFEKMSDLLLFFDMRGNCCNHICK